LKRALWALRDFNTDDLISDGADKKGFCSNFLNEIPLGQSVACYIRASPSFHLPDKAKNTPLVRACNDIQIEVAQQITNIASQHYLALAEC